MRDLLHATADHAVDWLQSLGERAVRPDRTAPEQLALVRARGLPDGPQDPRAVIDELVADADGALLATGSPRFVGWVFGAALPASLAADWLASAWDQNAGLAAPAPAAPVFEEVAGGWLLDLLRLPADASFALVTGCQMAHVTALAAARHRVLADHGWDVERDGLAGSPPVRVLAGEERHATLDRALHLLGIGGRAVELLSSDDAGALRPDALASALAGARGPVIVCAQAGNVNTGAVDPLAAVCDAAAEAGAWVHVDGAFGLWAAASADPERRALLAGAERAQSWATDAHKILNVPYDSGLAVVADREAHRAALAFDAGYVVGGGDGPRDPIDYTPEFSRRARGIPVYAALRELGRSGVAELVDRFCSLAARFAAALDADPTAEVLAHGLNQTLVRFGGDDAVTDAVIDAVRRDGTAYMTATTWRGMRAMRISVCSWRTTAADVDRSVAALLGAARAAR